MSFSINRAILLGNVTRDPELRMTKAGHPIMTVNLATNHSVKQADGSYQDFPTFHRVVVFGNICNWLVKNIFKGTKVYVDGRISTREYEDKAGVKQRSREIIAENVIPMSTQQVKSMQNSTVTQGVEATPVPKTVQDTVKEETPPENGGSQESINPDDIPF